MTRWFAVERGSRRPLVLLHGIGMAHSAWNPVLDRLAEHRRVIAVDLPGFGQSEPLPQTIEPTPAAMGDALVEELRNHGVEPPFDMAGNSLGGWVALEVAKAGRARSVVGLSPAGLWRQSPQWVRLNFRFARFAAQRVPSLAKLGAILPPTRTLGALVPVAWKGWRIPASDAVEAVENFGHGDTFERVIEVASTGFRGGREIDVPVTVAFGERDLLLRQGARLRGELPPQTRWLSLPGCGHVPMWDDPEAVARVVLEGTGAT